MRIGIDLGGTKIAGIVMDDDGVVVQSLRIPTPIDQGYACIVDALANLALGLEHHAQRPCSVGIGTPGTLSRRSGCLKNSNATCLNGRPLRDDLERALNRPIRMANDANCFVLSEATDGAASAHRLVLGIILGTGVGGGIAIGKVVHEGANDIAGEWGHVSLDPLGPQCYCGKKGCIETYLSGPALLLDYRRCGGLIAQTATHVALLAQNKEDLAAVTAINRYLERFGQAMAMAINILDPTAIVLGGGLSNMGCLYDEGAKKVAQNVFNDDFCTPIIANRHGDASGVRGAALLWPARDKAVVKNNLHSVAQHCVHGSVAP